jgi:hypothetical protein
MNTYSHWDVLFASPTEPLSLKERHYHLTRIWFAFKNIESGKEPTLRDWESVADAINMMDTMLDLNLVEDKDHIIEDSIMALAKCADRAIKGAHFRLDGPAITLIRGILEDYADILETLPQRTVIKVHRFTEKRLDKVIKQKKVFRARVNL